MVFFWLKGNQGKQAAGQMAWGVPRAVGARPLFPWEKDRETWHQISVGLAGQQQGHAVEAIVFCMASVCLRPAAGQLSLHFQIS